MLNNIFITTFLMIDFEKIIVSLQEKYIDVYNIPADFINEQQVWEILNLHKTTDSYHVREILGKAAEMKGLEMDEVAVLTGISDPELLGELFNTANQVKETIYGCLLYTSVCPNTIYTDAVPALVIQFFVPLSK